MEICYISFIEWSILYIGPIKTIEWCTFNFPQIECVGSDELFVQFVECQFYRMANYRMTVHSIKLVAGLLGKGCTYV